MTLSTQEIITFILQHFHGAFGAIGLALPILSVFMAMELIRPGKRLDLKSTLFNIWYTPVFLTLSSILLALLWDMVPANWTVGLLTMDPSDPITLGLSFALYLLIFDFAYYWLHRAQHTMPWLWRYHATHHADPNVSCLTTSRHHWLEEVFRFVPILLPLSIVFGSLSKLPIWALVLPGLFGIFIHWNTPWRMNLIAKWIVTPWFHRIHHSIQPEHHNKNYAVFFPIWDIIFGSAYFAKAHEYPNTGIISRHPTNSLKRLLPIPHQ